MCTAPTACTAAGTYLWSYWRTAPGQQKMQLRRCPVKRIAARKYGRKCRRDRRLRDSSKSLAIGAIYRGVTRQEVSFAPIP